MPFIHRRAPTIVVVSPLTSLCELFAGRIPQLSHDKNVVCTCLEMVPSHALSPPCPPWTRPGIDLLPIDINSSPLLTLYSYFLSSRKTQLDADLRVHCCPFIRHRLLCLQLCHHLFHIQRCCLRPRDHPQGMLSICLPSSLHPCRWDKPF